MFAPDAATHLSSSTRNPRRRQRPSLDDSIQPPRAKRQRSVLRQDTFEPTIITSSSLTKQSTDIEHKSPSPLQSRSTSLADGLEAHLAFRGPKNIEQSSSKKDGTVVISRNDHYTVSQLPSVPDQFIDPNTGPLKCIFAAECGYALLLTDSQALIWPYATYASTPATEVLSVAIPEWCRSFSGSALNGTLVSNATSTVPGLMVVAPQTGKIIYWENASNAAVLGVPKQRQNGLQGVIPGLLSGETVIDVINAEPSGIIVTLSSGRVGHVTVRDAQGKPTLSVNFLRGNSRIGPSGLFSGIRSVLGSHSWRKDIAAARVGMSSQRGQRDIFIASSVGILEIWDTHWNNVNALRAQIDLRHEIFQSLGMSHSNEDFSHDLRVLDFIAVPKAPKVSPQGEQAYRQDTALYFLVVLMQGTIPKKSFVIESSLFDDSLDVISTQEVENQKFVRGLNGPNTRLHIPRPWNMAFIVSSQAIILLSMRKAEASPSAQLLQDVVPKYFQDRIQFRSEGNYEILGSGIEDQTSEMKSSACVIMVKRFGLVRITTSSRQFQEFDFEDTRVTVKQRLEQAIFYGTMSENPLDFDDESNTISSVEELEDAALEICKELLQSKSKFVPSAALSLDQHLRLRAKALNDLGAELLRRKAPLTQRVRWELLWAAEKLASQRTMWKVEEGFRRRWEGSQTFLSRVLNLMNDKFKTKFEPIDAKENDHVRHWFLHDTYRMEHVIPWIFNALRDSKSATSRLGIQFLEQIYQASELSLAILETAFRFREDHAVNFGLGEESLDDGVLQSSYAGLPEFWTSQTMVYAETEHLLDLELESCRSWMQQPISKIERSDSLIPNHIAQNSCRQLRTFSKMHHERVRWLSDQTEPRLVDEKSAIEKSHKEQRKWQLFRMAGIGQLQGAITLAEDFRDMEALVELMVELQDQIRDQNVVYEASSSNAQLVCHDMNSFAQRITRYFECFGESWADAFFSRQIVVGQPGMLLSMKEYQQYVTPFLRKSPSYYRLAWINDIVGEDDYHTASHALEYLALEQETNLWDKRVETSLAKLTKLASWERDGRLEQANGLEEIRMLDAVAELGSIQDLVYDHISPALHGAIDRKAELELAMDHFGKYIVSNRPALRELLEDALANVIDRRALGVDQLIDLLTLMDPMHFLEGEESGLLGHEFHLALRILRLSHYADSDPAYYDALQMTIWRRCMIRDNWEGIGKKELRLDADLETHVRNTSLLHTLAECASEELYEGDGEAILYPRVKPSQILSSSSDKQLRGRFRPEQWPHIQRDLELENDVLRQYMENGKLELWFKDLLELAASDSQECHFGGYSGTIP